MNKFGQKIGQTTGLNKVQKMENVGLKFNLHPLVLAIIIVIGIYILYRAFWPRAKTYFRWEPTNNNLTKCKLMKNVASPAIGDPNLPNNQRYGCAGAVEVVNGTPIYQEGLCKNESLKILDKYVENNRHVSVTDIDEAKRTELDGRSDLTLRQDGLHFKYYIITDKVQSNTPWYKDCCIWNADDNIGGGGGICLPRLNGD